MYQFPNLPICHMPVVTILHVPVPTGHFRCIIFLCKVIFLWLSHMYVYKIYLTNFICHVFSYKSIFTHDKYYMYAYYLEDNFLPFRFPINRFCCHIPQGSSLTVAPPSKVSPAPLSTRLSTVSSWGSPSHTTGLCMCPIPCTSWELYCRACTNASL